MNKFLLFSSLLWSTLLSSCGFLLSPVGEELVVDAAQEVIKIEQDLTHPKLATPAKEPEKDVVKESPK